MLLAVYALALIISAALLFVLEPLVGKLALPLLGSTPEVWNATVMFFQAALLAGYAYSHATSRRLRPRTQAALQLALLAVAAVALPIALPLGAHPPASADPVPWLVWLLALTAGLPFLALAANTPMLQHWLAGRRVNPYVLYAASNAGSIVGLLAYPLLIERLLTLHQQGIAWSIGYGVVFVLVLACAFTLRGRHPTSRTEAPAESAERRPLKWTALAFVPSSLMLGTTSYITRDLSPVPLLWVIPLAVYLLTFVIAFAPGVRPAAIVDVTRKLLPIVLIVVVYTLALGSQRPLSLLLPLHLLGLAVAALMCHSRLAAGTPPASDLTRFYLCIALGGVLGGIFNALIAPVVFPTLIEYPLALVAAALLRPAPPKTRPDLLEFLLRDPRPTRWMDFVAPVLVGAALVVAIDAVGGGLGPRSAVLGVICGLVVNFGRRPVRFGLAVAAILLAAGLVGIAGGGGRVLARERSFFGVYKVVSTGGYHQLYDGTTLHGIERIGAGTPVPLSYYGRPGPAGQAFAELPASETRTAALIGLGAGALACYTPADGQFTFFEVDPDVAAIARNPRLFTYLRECPGRHPVVVGDGRLSLARAGRYGVVVLDAFNSDAIPVHLITRQAVELYLRHGRTVLYHVSNRYLALEPVLGDIARSLHLVCLGERHVPTPAQSAAGYSVSQWAVLAPTRASLGRLAADGRWHACRTNRAAVWTDDYSNVFSAIRWG